MKHNPRYIAAVAATAAGLLTPSLHAQDDKATVHYINGPRADAGIPRPGMTPVRGQVAVVITDPQNDFLSTNGVAWGVVGQNVTENQTVENLESLFKAARNSGVPVFISPHYYYQHDHQWKFEGALEALMHKIGMFDRKGAFSQEGFEGSGADWLPRYKSYINDGKTIVCSPHKVFGPESNDLALQLRKAGISQIVLAGMSANLCVASHMRVLIELSFHVVVVPDATGTAKLPGYDGFDTVALFTDAKPVNGSPFITAEHQGAIYYFASEDQ